MISGVNDFKVDSEYAMRPARSVVHLVGSDNLVLDSLVVQVNGVLGTLAVADEQVLHCEL